MSRTAAERYIQLGLRLGRLDDGVVDAYFGPPELAAEVAAEAPATPQTLVATADALLDELDEGWLHDQVSGLRTYAGVLAGESWSYSDEAQGCYGVRPVHTDEATFVAAHEQLEELLPGSGALAERYQKWRDSNLVPEDLVEQAMAAAIEEARAQTQHLWGLPAGESISLELVRDEPWMAYNYYLGDLRGRVAINNSLSMSGIELLHIAIHETYPGHQAERSIKEQLLVRDQEKIEETLVLAPTPQSLISEGIGELAPQLLLEGDGADAFGAIIRRAGIKFDLAQARAIEQARQQCQWAMVNAGLMLHEAGAEEAETHAYLERWGLLNTQQAAHATRFITEPDSRTYATVYPAGLALCRDYVAGDVERFGRLLTQQLRIRDLSPR